MGMVFLLPTGGTSKSITSKSVTMMPYGGVVSVEAAAAATCALTGTITDDTETDIQDGGSTIILTLTGDTFVTGATSEDAIAAGSDSNVAATGTSWDSLVKSDLDNTDVVLSGGNTVATITMPAYGTYDIIETETITWTIPAASLTTSGSPIEVSPTFEITHVAAAGFFARRYYDQFLGAAQ